ncbi:MAG: hypothetical protein KatS3mg032_0522 [Cyclobacteriaceae bacterium]|nr:MAG: hypothetical protein KatS3mg032_0522 [Cyclobacteriaceae bacterium]
MIGEYNTQRPNIILKEYGRNVQKLVEYLRTIPDKQKRTDMARTLIGLIKQLTPSLKEQPENDQRLWDDLYIMADFNLDLDNPYPVPARDVLFKKPQKMNYPQTDVRYRHYGKNIERLIQEAVKKEDPQEREEAVIYLGKLMKTFYSNWNKETLDDSVILNDIKAMSGGKLSLDIDKVREDNLFEKLYRDRKKLKPVAENGPRNGGHRHRHKKMFRKRRDNG